MRPPGSRAGVFIGAVSSMPTMPPRYRPLGAPTHQQAEARRKALYDKRRPSPAERGYDGAWRRCRALFLAANPKCSWCPDPATEVDHKLSPKTHPHLRLSWSNLRGGCKPCHSRRTALEQGFARGGPRDQGPGGL